MKHRNHLYFLLPALFCTLFFSCQEDTIEPDIFGGIAGQVLLDTDNAVLEGVTISTTPPTSTLLTDNEGRFTFDPIKTGSYTLRAEKNGYTATLETVTVFENQTATVVMQLRTSDADNHAPASPVLVAPGSSLQIPGIQTTLAWTATDADDDALTFDVYLFDAGQMPGEPVALGISDTMLTVSDLQYGSTYFWQVVANDGIAGPVYGEVWNFSTPPFPEHPFVFVKAQNGKLDIFAAQSGSLSEIPYQLTTQAGSNYRPRISPEGNRIAFLSNNLPDTWLYVMNRDGSEPVLVPTPVPVDGNDKFQLDFCWSPDGTKLLFMNDSRLYLVNIDGSGFQLFAELTTGEDFVEVDWAPVTHRIAARTVGALPYQSRIILYDEAGTSLGVAVPDLTGNLGGPVFSVDGQSLLYTQDVDGLETADGRQLNAHIFLKNLSTSITSDLSLEKPAGYNDLDARFSPDGALVIFVQRNNVPGSPKDIFLMNLQGAGRTKLFESAEMPDWR